MADITIFGTPLLCLPPQWEQLHQITVKPINCTYPLQQFVGHLESAQAILEALTELLQAREGPVGSQLGSIEHLGLLAVHQNIKVRGRGFGSRAKRKLGVLISSQIVDQGGLATAPWAHEEDQGLGEDLGVTKVSVAQVAVLVQSLQRLDRVLVDLLQLLQHHFRLVVDHQLNVGRGCVQVQQVGNVIAVS